MQTVRSALWIVISVALVSGGVVAYLLLQHPKPVAKLPAAPVVLTADEVQKLQVKADQGDARAETALGDFYAQPENQAQNYSNAAKWYKLGAEKGDAGAQLGLGQLYEAGRGVARDTREALKLYRLAAAQGSAAAQYTVGFMYEAGRAVPADQVEAAKWFKQAAEQGDALSQYDLGQRYDVGAGVQVDLAESLKWLTLAAAQGQPDAVTRLAAVRHKASSEQIAESKRRLDAFSAKTR